MAFSDFLDGFVDFLDELWEGFVEFLDELVRKVITSITSWVHSIINFIQTGDFIVTDGPTSARLTPGDLQKALAGTGHQFDHISGAEEKAKILDFLVANAMEQKKRTQATFQVPLTDQEGQTWKSKIGEKFQIYEVQRN